MSSPCVVAQQLSVPGGNSGVETDDDIITLSPFEIDASNDVGWRSTNSTSGTSLNTPIKELPMSIEVINRDFLDDTQAVTFREALQYSAGVVLDQFTPGSANGPDGNNGPGVNQATFNERSASSRGGLGQRFSNAVNIRGFNVPFQNRDGFRYGGAIASYGIILGGYVDTANVNRMEVVRGPNSLLYGIGVLSGIVNMIPKRPLSEPAGSASVSFGSYGYMRGTFDWTAPLKKDLWGGVLSYRVGAALTRHDDWTDWRSGKTQYYVGQLEFKNDKWNVFFEAQHADQTENGIGAQFTYDNTAASIDPNFRNEYFEQWNVQKDFNGLPQTTRITGPDTDAKHKETDLLFNVDFTPIENLTVSAGTFITRIDENEFDVNISVMTNEERGLDFKNVVVQRLLAAERAAAKDPADWTPGEGELAAQAPILRKYFDDYVWIRDSPEKANQPPNDPRQLTDYRFIRYWWRNTPKTADSEQYRVRATYNFETADFTKDSRAKHTLLGGFHYIHDLAEFTTGTETIGRNFANKGEIATDDPLLEKNLFDTSPIRYNGEPLSQPGRDMRRVDVWYQGLYGLYQGRILDDKLGVIAGLRWDQYHSKDQLYDRFNELEFVSDEFPYGPDYDGPPVYAAPSSIWWNNPESKTYGFVPPPEGQSIYSPGPDPESQTSKTIALNYRITPALTVYGLRSEGLTPNTGDRDGSFQPIPSETTTSEELGLKFDLFDGKLSGTAAVYRIRRENAIWYLASAPRPARWVGAPNPETGWEPDESRHFTPDLIENGTYVISYAIDEQYFIDDGVKLGPVTKIIYDDAGRPIARVKENPDGFMGFDSHAGGNLVARNSIFLQYDKLDLPVIGQDGVANGKTWRYYLEKAFADRGRSFTGYQTTNSPEDFDPMLWRRPQGTGLGLNPSLHQGANVTFTDEARGFDLQLIYQPTRAWQMVFTYAHTEREPITPFKLVEIQNPNTGFQYGTEYDAWVRTFGRAAFGLEEHDDDGDGVVDRVTKAGDDEVLKLGDVPTSSMVGGLEGISLYTGPEDTFSIFQKYSFLEGRLKGLAANLGITYTGPAQTSIPIGGSDLAENRFGTPPTPSRWLVNLGFSYNWRWGDQNYDARLTINNLLDDQKGESRIEYVDDDGSIVPRRFTRYYTPRTLRFTLSVRF